MPDVDVETEQILAIRLVLVEAGRIDRPHGLVRHNCFFEAVQPELCQTLETQGIHVARHILQCFAQFRQRGFMVFQVERAVTEMQRSVVRGFHPICPLKADRGGTVFTFEVEHVPETEPVGRVAWIQVNRQL